MIDKLIDKVKDNIIRDGDYTYWAEKSYDIINRYKEDKTTTEEDSEPADHNLNEYSPAFVGVASWYLNPYLSNLFQFCRPIGPKIIIFLILV